MAEERFSERQRPEDPEGLNQAIRAAIVELNAAFPGSVSPPRHWNDDYIAVPLEVTVDLPTRGTGDGVDIRRREPVILLFHRKDFPHRAPAVRSDRLDFPKARLPHLNPTKPGQPASFCLHRGDFNAWFAEHTVIDVVKRVRSWLRDAARGRLIREEDAFEPTRPAEPLGYAIFDPVRVLEHVQQAWAMCEGCAGGCATWYERLSDEQTKEAVGQDSYAIQLVNTIAFDLTAPLRDLGQRINELVSEMKIKDDRLRKQVFGILAWPSERAVCRDYFGEIPDQLGEFVAWAERLGIPLNDCLTRYLEMGLQLLGGIPASIVIPRPQRLIGSRSRNEIINFVITMTGEHAAAEGKWHPEAKVMLSDHRTPLTPVQARRLSNVSEDVVFAPILFLGVGALGSKIALHFARAGQTGQTLIDFDILSPHNLVRHALLSAARGKEKAIALKEEISRIYWGQDVGVDARAASALPILGGDAEGLLPRHGGIVDATASPMVMNALVEASLPERLHVWRTEIGDMGRLGFLVGEGEGRNPRLDDLQVELFDAAIQDDGISQWLRTAQREREGVVGSSLEEIQIGLSCSSATMRLADDVVSFHAAAVSRALRNLVGGQSPAARGVLIVSRLTQDGTGRVDQLHAVPILELSARNERRWRVRLNVDVADEMKELLRRHRPAETGGLLIGQINFRRRIIYVTRLIPAARDSRASPYGFMRGTRGMPQAIRKIEDRTGGLIGYVGEWHTHPAGGPKLSNTDKEAVAALRRRLDPVRLPTHVMVVTPRGYYPHIFSLR